MEKQAFDRHWYKLFSKLYSKPYYYIYKKNWTVSFRQYQLGFSVISSSSKFRQSVSSLFRDPYSDWSLSCIWINTGSGGRTGTPDTGTPCCFLKLRSLLTHGDVPSLVVVTSCRTLYCSFLSPFLKLCKIYNSWSITNDLKDYLTIDYLRTIYSI